MKHIFLSIVFVLFTLSGFSQTSSESIYLILTSTTSEENPGNGIIRSSLLSSSRYNLGKYPSIFFHFYVERKSVTLHHTNYDIEKLRTIRQPNKDGSDEMEIITKPESFLKEISYIDLDEFMKSQPTKEQLWDLGDKLQYKKVYVIDRNDMKDGKISL